MNHKTKRLLYLGFGWLMFALGFIGAFLPVVPTTPFMLLALWGFSNGSETLHHWLYNHPRFGPTLQDWDQYGVIPVKAKVTAILTMVASALFLIFFVDIPLYGLITALVLMMIGASIVITRPSKKPDKEEDHSSNTIK